MILKELTIKDEISTGALRIAQAYDIRSIVGGVERTRIVAITTSDSSLQRFSIYPSNYSIS